MPKIIVSGLTAAGKTTHARLIAKALSIPYFSGSGLLSQLAGVPGPWSPELDQLRSAGSLDTELDRLMVAQLRDSEHGVFDAWTLPWLVSENCLKIWIESDFPSRVLKAMVSELRKGRHPVADEVSRMVRQKDDFSRAMFERLYSFDLYVDHEVFDTGLDCSQYITRPTIEDSDAGIQRFDAIVMAALKSAIPSE
jgi:cytidylate kinase